MRHTDTILAIIGYLLVMLQLYAYSENGVFFPPYHHSDDMLFTIASAIGGFAGHNFIGLAGLFFVFIAYKIKPKPNLKKDKPKED